MIKGTNVGKAYVDVTVDGDGINEQIVDGVDGAGPGVEKAGEDHGDRYGTKFSDRFRAKLDGIKEKISTNLGDKLEAAGQAAGDRAGERAGKSMLTRIADVLDGDGDSVADKFADRLGERIADRLELALASQGDIFESLIEKVSGNGGGGSRRPAANKGDTDFASKLGSILGAGSRNNALNLIGKSVENLVGLFTKVTSGVSRFGDTFGKAFSEAGEGASVFTKTFAGAGAAGSEALTSIAASAPLALAGIAVVTIAASVLVSVLGALLGLAVALASTLATALVGAAGVAAGALGVIGVAAGLVAVAFTSMTDAQQAALGASFQPLKAELTGIGQLMITQIIPYFDTWSRNLQQGLLLIAPLAQRMGDVFGRAGNILTAAFSGPGFQLLFQQLGVYLPSIVLNLSRAFSGFLNGVAGLLAGILPSVQTFSGYLSDLATRFQNFTASAQGQNAIESFMNRAIVAVQSAYGFISALGGLIGDVLFSRAGNDAGNSIFDGLTDAINRARKAISNGDLEKWFKDAIDFGKDLAQVMDSLRKVFVALYDSNVLKVTGKALIVIGVSLESAATLVSAFISAIDNMPSALTGVLEPLSKVGGVVGGLSGYLLDFLDIIGVVEQKASGLGATIANGINQGLNAISQASYNGGLAGQIFGANSQFNYVNVPTSTYTPIDYSSLLSSGNNALNQTSVDSGGYLQPPTKAKDPKKPAYKNPYIDFANSLIQSQPTVIAQMKAALRQLNKSVADVIDSASTAANAGVVQNAFNGQIDTLKDKANQLVSSAQSTLSSSAQTLANATNKKDAKAALKQVKADQKALTAAMANQDKINAAAKILADQTIVSQGNVDGLLAGFKNINATLADYAQAREIVTQRLVDANSALTAAIAVRDNYITSVTDAANAYGSILTAQAKTINGVTQALTADDITSNLQTRLNAIQTFQSNLQILLSQGLSDAAYKQLVDAGVEQGGAYAQALINGGQGAVINTNQLVAQIAAASDGLGVEAGSRLYQAGVDAAQGLVDGLTSLSDQLDSAAAQLGESIAAAVKRSLGIASPSKVMIAQMGYVGDGIEQGLDAQHNKVGSAAARLSSRVSMSPEVAAYAAAQNNGVSGNQTTHQWNLSTPSADPWAVAQELLNEVTGRL